MSTGESGDFRPPVQFSAPVFPPPVFPGSSPPVQESNGPVPQSASPPSTWRRSGGVIAVLVLAIGLAIAAAIVKYSAPDSSAPDNSSPSTQAAGPATETIPAQPLLPVSTQVGRDAVEQSMRTFYAGLGGNGASGGQVCGIFQTLWEDDLRGQTFRIDFVDAVDISTTSAYVDYTASKFRSGAPTETVQLTTLMKNEGGVWKWCGSATR